MSKVYCLGDSFICFVPQEQDTPLRDVASFHRFFSGSGAAVSHAVASLSGSAVFLGAVAKDFLGDYIRRKLRTAGVDISNTLRVEDADTPILFLDNAGQIGKSYVRRSPWCEVSPEKSREITLRREDILHLEAACLIRENTHDYAAALLQQARAVGCLVSIDASNLLPTTEFLEILKQDYSLLFQENLLFLSQKSMQILDTVRKMDLQELASGNIAVLMQSETEGITCVTAEATLPGGGYTGIRRWDDVRHTYMAGFLCDLTQSNAQADWNSLGRNRNALSKAMAHARAAATLAATRRGCILGATAPNEVKKMLTTEKSEAIMRERTQLKELAGRDYYRLQYHVMPECGWLNDPNGLVEYNGQYHAFYQHYPDAAEWGPMHWGHAVSDDLVHWKHLPIALSPDQPYEKGCFSGSAVDNGGELTLIYTAHDDSRSPKEMQCIATSKDGVSFEKYMGNPVITAPPKGMGEDFRDPKVSFVNGKWHMVVGCTEKSLGGISMYVSEDLRSWEYKGLICKSNGKQGDMWECPDLFALDGKDVLMCSPMNMKNSKTMFITGKMDYDQYRFTQEQYYEVDYGHEFYAPQTLLDSQGRRILIGWMEMWGNEYPTQKNGWAGALTLPRELFLSDGYVCQRPVRETETLRSETLFSGPLTLAADQHGNLSTIAADCMEVKLSAKKADRGVLTLHLRASEDFKEQTLVSYDFGKGQLIVDTRSSGQGRCDKTVVDAPLKGDALDLHLFVDRSSVEVFCGGGRYVVSSRIYPDAKSWFCDIAATNTNISLENLEIHRL